MYTVTMSRSFVAQHHMPASEGHEREVHSHPYRVEVALSGERLTDEGFLVDLDEVAGLVDALLGRYRDETLNDLPEFEGTPPSIENFARVLWKALVVPLDDHDVGTMTVRLWESDDASASFSGKVRP